MENVFANLISEADAAKAAGECERTWRRRRDKRTGPAFIRWGQKVYYTPEALRDWVAAHKVQPKRQRAA